MTTTLVGFCESLTFCAPNMEKKLEILQMHARNLGFREEGIFFVTKMFDAESQCFVTYSS